MDAILKARSLVVLIDGLFVLMEELYSFQLVKTRLRVTGPNPVGIFSRAPSKLLIRNPTRCVSPYPFYF